MKKQLHPKMVAHAHAVKLAHAHLSATVPGFRSLPPHEQFKHTQDHIRLGVPVTPRTPVHWPHGHNGGGDE